MNAELLLLILAPPAIMFLLAVIIILPRRIRMERRARGLLAQHPGAERTSVYLQFRSILWGEKQREHDALIAEMTSRGWTFLGASEANPLRTVVTWAGGVNMHFIRARPSHESSPALTNPLQPTTAAPFVYSGSVASPGLGSPADAAEGSRSAR